MEIAFYRGPGNLITWTIRLITAGPYSHCELVFSDGNRAEATGRKTATQAKGVRWTAEPFPYFYWDLVRVPATHAQEIAAMRYVMQHAGKPFDWRGVASFLFPWIRSQPDARYCSEFVLATLQECCGILLDAGPHISPNELCNLLGGTRKPLSSEHMNTFAERYQFDIHPSAIIAALKAADRQHVALRAEDAKDQAEAYPIPTDGNLTLAFQGAFAKAMGQYPDCRQYGIYTFAEILSKSSTTPFEAERYDNGRHMVAFTLVAQ